MKDKKEDFWVECNVCKTQLKNWVGSTPCCGSIAFIVTETIEQKKIRISTERKNKLNRIYV